MLETCPWEAAKYFVYSSNVPPLFFYSHIPAMAVAMLLGLAVFYKSGKSRLGATLLTISALFSLWSVFDLVLWATNSPDVVVFFWSLQILFEPLIYLLCFYLLYLFIRNEDLIFKWKLFGMLLYLPVVLYLPTKYNILGVNLSDCTAVEGFIAHYYSYIIEVILITCIISLSAIAYRKTSDKVVKKEILLFSIGVISFLAALSSGNIIGSFTENWNLAQAGLIGMPILVCFLAYLIVKFKAFNIKLIATQVLVWGIIVIIGSQFFFIKNSTSYILNSFAFIASIIFGYALFKSVKREIQQKEELARLNVDLENVIKQRESLVHLVTHKVKGSFTRSKYIFAGILDGTFGDVTPEIKKIAQEGLESDNMGIETVDLVLNVANLEKGIVKYDMKKVELKELVEKIISEKRISAEARGLTVQTDIKEGSYSVLGDPFWLKEVVNNLIENSVKYTMKGGITIGLLKVNVPDQENKKIRVYVKDTGIGIADEDKANLFTEGGRGKDSTKLNVDSTGYGLYSVKLIVEAHKGRTWMESAGKDMGSVFWVELDEVI